MRRGLALAAALAALAAASPAAAHVDVLPTRATLGAPVEWTVRVPSERPLPTVGLRVLFPPQVTVYSFASPPPGWRLRALRAPDGRLRGVEYTGGRIGVDRYQDFTFLGTPFEPGQAVWRALQTYADGKVKPWTGAPEPPGTSSAETGPTEPGPAAVTEIVEGETVSPASPQAASTPAEGSSGAGVWLGLIGIGVAALACVGVGLLWAGRPAELPADEDEDEPAAPDR